MIGAAARLSMGAARGVAAALRALAPDAVSKRRPLASGSAEPPLSAFVSSVMRPELEQARAAVSHVLQGVPFLYPWRFESTPASSESPDESYLRHVREATFVIWLAGEETTGPVENEIREAIAAERRLLVFLLPAAKRADRTTALIEEVKPHTKLRKVAREDSLEVELEAAISDEIVRALKGKPGLGRDGRLDQLGRASRARLIDSWRAAGLERQLALELADDPAVGKPAAELRPADAAPVIVISGVVGVGKSLIGERLHQEAIARALTDGSAPIPVWLRAGECGGGLQVAVRERCAGLGNPELQGAFIVVDAADEAGPARAEELLGEARILADTWLTTSCVISSRPFPALTGLEEVRKVHELSEEEGRALIARVTSEGEASITRSWPANMREAIKLPLFALMIAAVYRAHDGLVPHSRAQLIEATIADRLRVDDDETRTLLRRLAVSVIRRGVPEIQASELGSQEEVEKLMATRLVSSRGQRLFFPLILFAQWFAAETFEGLEGAELDRRLEQIAEAPDDWLYPLAIFSARASAADADTLLGPIARRQPGFASQIVEDGISRWGTLEDDSPVPQKGTAEELRRSMSAWVEGIEPLAQLIAPVDRNGALRPVASRAEGGRLITSWYRGEKILPPASQLPPEVDLFHHDLAPDWYFTQSGPPAAQASWAWRWALEALRINLTDVLKARALRLDAGPIAEAELYAGALLLLGRGSGGQEPIAIAEGGLHVPARFL